MGVQSMDNIPSCCPHLYGKHTFSDNIAGVWSHNVYSQNRPIFSITNHLNHTHGLTHSESTTAGEEGEFTHFIRNTLIVCFHLGDANTGNLRLGKDTTRNSVIICLAGVTKGILSSYLSLIGGNMGEHALAKNIANGINIIDICLKVFIHHDGSPIHSYAEFLQTQSLSIG